MVAFPADGEVEADRRRPPERARSTREPPRRGRAALRRPRARARSEAGSCAVPLRAGCDPARSWRASPCSDGTGRNGGGPGGQPYHVGTVSQVRPARPRASCAASACRRWRKRPYTVGPAPVTSARNAPSRTSSAASGDEARSFGGSSASRRALVAPARAASSAAPAVVPAVRPVPLVEALVDRSRRFLQRAVREHEQHPVVLRQLERGELGAVSAAELRPRRQEERDIGAEPSREPVELGRRQRLGEREVREAERGRGVGATATEPGRNRNPLRDHGPPKRLDTGGGRELLERSTDERVSRDSRSTVSRGAAEIATRSPRSSRWSTVATSCLPSARRGPTTSARFNFADAGARLAPSDVTTQRPGRRTRPARAPRHARWPLARSPRAPRLPVAGWRARPARVSSAASSAGARTTPRRPA